MKDAYYFSHDSNASNDTKILTMRCDYGLEGYGMYWIIIEALRNESEYKLKLEQSTCKALAMQMHSKTDAVEKFINDCIDQYGLLKCTDGYFYAESLLRRMDKREEIRNKRKDAANKRWNQEDNANAMQKDSISNANAMQGKERKGKEIERKDIYIDYVQLTVTEYNQLLEKLSPKERDTYIERLNDYIGQIGVDQANKKYKSHYHVIMNWFRKDIKDSGSKAKKSEILI